MKRAKEDTAERNERKTRRGGRDSQTPVPESRRSLLRPAREQALNREIGRKAFQTQEPPRREEESLASAVARSRSVEPRRGGLTKNGNRHNGRAEEDAGRKELEATVASMRLYRAAAGRKLARMERAFWMLDAAELLLLERAEKRLNPVEQQQELGNGARDRKGQPRGTGRQGKEDLEGPLSPDTRNGGGGHGTGRVQAEGENKRKKRLLHSSEWGGRENGGRAEVGVTADRRQEEHLEGGSENGVPEAYAFNTESLLRQIAREWSTEGDEERRTAFDPLLEALEKCLPCKYKDAQAHMKQQESASRPRVLVPGCGTGRLPFEIAQRGYLCEANEASYHMVLALNFFLNACEEPRSKVIFPYCLGASNRAHVTDTLQGIVVPDVVPRSVPGAHIQLRFGDFLEVW
uniref:Uncharacterized protein n=1 Tax=Neospora caninum (strain Liverpool) TaxID=572307 RepID=F0JB73_NEOCL|nr:hypothetical protein, conserved [Neospora caninum Liverpool]CEL71340.1 TPA: hypothetical protein, conserved [Neospora caninum Liverpool]